MKTKEFIKEMEYKGYVVNNLSDCIAIRLSSRYLPIACVDKTSPHIVNTDYPMFRKLSFEQKRDLLHICTYYVNTPIEEREEEKKYYVRYSDEYVKCTNHSKMHCYVNSHLMTGDHNFSSKRQYPNHKTQFTQNEIDNFPRPIKQMLDIGLLVKEEVGI